MAWTRRKFLQASAVSSIYSFTELPLAAVAPITALAAFDHIQLGSADLDGGIIWFEKRTGVRAAFGGVHPGGGTRNALVSLGKRHYLEVYALDPQQPNVDNEDVQKLRRLASPAVMGWAIGTQDLDGLKRDVEAAGFKTITEAGSRQRPDGKLLRWRLLLLVNPPPLAPFAIEWSADSPHPSTDSPPAGTVAQLIFETADPQQLRKAVRAFGVVADIRRAAAPSIRLTLATKKGRIAIS